MFASLQHLHAIVVEVIHDDAPVAVDGVAAMRTLELAIYTLDRLRWIIALINIAANPKPKQSQAGTGAIRLVFPPPLPAFATELLERCEAITTPGGQESLSKAAASAGSDEHRRRLQHAGKTGPRGASCRVHTQTPRWW